MRYRPLLVIIILLCTVHAVKAQTEYQKNEQSPSKNFRFIYNCDGMNMFTDVQPPMTPETLYPYIDEVATTGATSFFISPNVGMPMNYPTKVGDMIGENTSKEIAATITEDAKKGTLARGIINLRSLIKEGHDPLEVIISRIHEKKMEAFISFRPNEVHAVEQKDNILFSRFWKQHPEWRIGKYNDPVAQVYKDIMGPNTSPIVTGWLPAGLNFAIPQVREYKLALLREMCERYDINGIEIDFQRFPMYFKPGEEGGNISTMTEWMKDVRAMTKEVAARKGKPILLTCRILARPEQNAAVGLDPVTWAQKNLIDFVTISHYLHNDFPLSVSDYRKIFPKRLPMYASIEVEKDMSTYRKIADHLWESGIDGIYLFNFFTTREGGVEPAFNLIHEIKYPAQRIADSSSPRNGSNQKFKSIFNGKDLTGWTIHGTEKWYVEKGELICENGPDKEYGYLSTDKNYKNFILTLKFKQVKNGNSGVFIRSTIEGVKISGWQVEVAPKGLHTGGIYESYGRGWLKLPEPEDENNLRVAKWNTMRIEVVGDTVTTWLNGKEMVHLVDNTIGKGVGFIALQIHNGGDIKVKWKDIMIKELPTMFP